MKRTLTYQIKTPKKSIRSYLEELGYPKTILRLLKADVNLVLLNSLPSMLYTPLEPNDTLSISIPEIKSHENICQKKMPLTIIYEDEDILIIDKPAGMPIHPSQNHYDDSLANALMYYYRENESPFIYRCMTRLDRDTSGIVLIAKNMLSAAILNDSMKSHTYDKEYLAIVSGKVNDSGTICAPIGRLFESTILRCIDYENGKDAITHYKRISYMKKETRDFSLVSIHTETGRTHQIRVHMASINHPLLGDFLYNPDDHTMARQALHARSLTIKHPITRQEMTFESALPADFKDLIED